jgi:hypothetical protein
LSSCKKKKGKRKKKKDKSVTYHTLMKDEGRSDIKVYPNRYQFLKMHFNDEKLKILNIKPYVCSKIILFYSIKTRFWSFLEGWLNKIVIEMSLRSKYCIITTKWWYKRGEQNSIDWDSLFSRVEKHKTELEELEFWSYRRYDCIDRHTVIIWYYPC